MDIRILKYFLMVAREENITHASKQLHISQPSLSKQLMELEQEIGKQLFIRTKRKITLTEEGKLLKKRAEEIVYLFDKTEKELLMDDTHISGDITIGGSPLPEVLDCIQHYQKKYPDVQFHFYGGDADEIKEKMNHGNIDFAILLQPIDMMQYECIPFKKTHQWGLLLPKDSKLAKKESIQPRDIKKAPLILHQRKELQREISIWANQEISNLNVVATYNIIHGDPTIFVKSGVGYIFSIDATIQNQDVCFRPLDPPLTLQYCFVWKRYATFTKASALFLQMMQEKK